VLSLAEAALGSFRCGRRDTAFQVTLDDTGAIEILWEAAELDIMVVVARAGQGRPWVSWQMELGWVCAADNIIDRGRPLDIVIFAEPCSWATPNARGTRETQRRSADHIQQR
jgi:hypothetical protein